MEETMTKARNERFKQICQRARELWEIEGRPPVKQDEFWLAAMAEVDACKPSSDLPSIGPEQPSLLSQAVAAVDKSVSQTVKQHTSTRIKMHSSRL
jgi:hypothetical protein